MNWTLECPSEKELEEEEDLLFLFFPKEEELLWEDLLGWADFRSFLGDEPTFLEEPAMNLCF